MISFRSCSTYAPNTATVNHPVPVPTGVVAGDFLLVVFNLPVAATFNALGGWTELWDTSTGGDVHQMMVSWRIATASEPASYTWVSTGSGRPVASMFAWTGVAGFGTSQFSLVTSATHTSPSITPTDYESMIVAIDDAYYTAAGSSPAFTADPIFTPRLSLENVNNHAGIFVSDYLQTTARAISFTNTLAVSSGGAPGIVALSPNPASVIAGARAIRTSGGVSW